MILIILSVPGESFRKIIMAVQFREYLTRITGSCQFLSQRDAENIQKCGLQQELLHPFIGLVEYLSGKIIEYSLIRKILCRYSARNFELRPLEHQDDSGS